MKDYSLKELYLGCECHDLDHITYFCFLPLTQEEREKGKMEETIDIEVKLNNCLNRFFPPLNKYIFTKWEWKDYFYFHYFKRVWYGLKNIFKPFHYGKGGVFDCAILKNSDLDTLKDFLSQIVFNKEFDSIITFQSVSSVENNDWVIRFYMEQELKDYNTYYNLCWEIQFPVENLFRRIKKSIKYMLGLYDNRQISFEMNNYEIEKLKKMINWLQEQNRIIEKKYGERK